MNEPKVHAAKTTDHLISISSVPYGLCYLNLNLTDIIDQEKRCSKLVTTLVYFSKQLSFKIYENLY